MQIRDRVAEAGGVTKQIALDWFSTLIGPVPGGQPVEGPQSLTSGTQAVLYITHVWDQLVPSQQRAVSDTLDVPAHAPPLGRFGGAAAGFSLAAPLPQPDALNTSLQAVVRELSRRTSSSPVLPVVLVQLETVEAGEDDHVDDYGYAMSARLDGSTWRYTSTGAEACIVALTPRGTALTGDDLEAVLAHEAFHCLSADYVGGWRRYSGLKAWLSEGTSTWVETVVGEAPPVTQEWWSAYLTERRPLINRSYDAMGFYAQLAATGTDVWHLMLPMLAAGNAGAVELAERAGGEEFLHTWASGLVRRPTWGPEWDTSGPGIPPDSRGVYTFLVTPDFRDGFSVKATDQALVGFVVEADDVEMLRVSAKGFGNWRWHADAPPEASPTHAIDGALNATFCMTGDCACEGEGPPPGVLDVPFDAPAGLLIGVSSFQEGSKVSATAMTIEEACEEVPQVTDQGFVVEGQHAIDIDVVTACEIRPFASRASEALGVRESLRISDPGIDLELRAAFIDEDEDEAATLDLWRLRGTWLPVRMDWGPLSVPYYERFLPRNTGVGLNWPTNRPDVEFQVDEETLSGTFLGIVRADPADRYSKGGSFSGSFNCGEEIPFPTEPIQQP